MNICVFSKRGILYDRSKPGSVLAIAVPSNDQKRQYADIANPSTRVIKERYGVLEGEVLYRIESGVVNVYGQLPKDLYDLRSEVKVFMPEDLVPLDVNVLYYAIGENLIVHSVRSFDTDGSSNWSSIYIELEKKGAGILNVIENLISERVVSSNDEKILVSFTGLDYSVKEELYQRLNQFGVIIEPIEKLTGHKSRTPVYSHKDNSILMMIFMIVAAILFVLSLSYYLSGERSLTKNDDKIVQLRQEFKESLSKRRLKKVANPQDVKNSIEKTFKARPSAIIHAASEVAALFGVLESVTLEKKRMDRTTRKVENKPYDNIIYVIASVKSSSNSLLIDQERLAKSVYETRRWIKSIERANKSSDGNLVLKIGVYVGGSGEF
ncbi:MAG TPA: hypothetical protein DCL21_02385 [Alphaproteobacteria bacterium]|nr:hypothetical protein [Alphaproteobacteria bacterium]